MEITNNYLFLILKDFLVGSILTVVPSVISYAVSIFEFDIVSVRRFAGFLYPLLACIVLIGVTYYFLALGKTLRYVKIRREDEDYLDTYLGKEKKEVDT